MPRFQFLAAGVAVGALAQPVVAQRSADNAVTAADDAFGSSIGNENIGLYGPNGVRGFSPIEAGNVRLDGLYFDEQIDPSSHLVSGSTIRVGISAQHYPLPAPTGIIDYQQRRPGPKALTSVYAAGGPFGSRDLEIDYQSPAVASGLGAVGGVTVNRTALGDGTHVSSVELAVAPRWTPSDALEFIPFASRAWNYGQRAAPLIFVDGPHLPPTLDRSHFYGQRWTAQDSVADNDGLLATARSGRTTARAGLFYSHYAQRHAFSDLFVDVDASGHGDHLVVAERGRRFAALSGEVRVQQDFGSRTAPETLYLIGRGRDERRRYGASDTIDFGVTDVTMPPALSEPRLAFSAPDRDSIRQGTAAIAYDGTPLGWLTLSAGLQFTDYRKSTLRHDAAEPATARTRALLWNAGAAFKLSQPLVLYASYTRGLEEGGVAPDNALNKGSAAPALVTHQGEVGLRYRFGDNLKLVAGIFTLAKPYYGVGTARVYRRLGNVQQRGLEMSVTGSPAAGLTVVAGALLLDPRVIGEEVGSGKIGSLPVGQTRRLAALSLDYRLPHLDRVSVNVNITSVARRVVSSANDLFIPPRTTLDLGARYRFQIAGASATLAGRVTNVFDDFGWRTNGSAVFAPTAPRGFQISLAADV